MAVLSVRVQPRSSRNAVTGRHGDTLRVTLTAPPVDGAANRACRDFLAEWLGVRRQDVTLVGGATSREKRFDIATLTADELAARLAAVPDVSA